MASYSTNEFRSGLKILIDNDPCIIVENEFVKPGKGQALYRCKLKNMITGSQFSNTYRSNDKFEKAVLEERKMQFLYHQGEEYHFMDTERKWVPFLFLGGGLSQPITNNTWLTAQVLFDVINSDNSPYKSWEPFFSIGIGVGF